MQTIETRYYGPTNRLGSRVRAWTSGGGPSVWLDWDLEANREENYMRAARLLKERMGWSGTMAGGDVKNGMVFVFIGEYEI